MKASPYWFACCALALSAAAQAPQLPAEFWHYLLEFSDENGELIDPLEFSQIETVSPEQAVKSQDNESDADTHEVPANKTQHPHPSTAEETKK